MKRAKHHRRPTIDDVGRAAGVSQTTVSYVLSGSKHAERISLDTKQRVVEAAQRLGYTRNSIGAALQRGYSNTIVLLVVSWDLTVSHAYSIMSLGRAAAHNGLSIIMHLAEDEKEALRFLSEIYSLNPYGLLLLWEWPDAAQERLKTLRSQSLPIVDLLPSNVKETVSVTADRKHGSYQAVKHLIDLGHRRIGFIRNNSYPSHLKLAGYKQALMDAGIDVHSDYEENVDARAFTFQYGYRACEQLLRRCPNLTAIASIGDHGALGAIAAAQDHGLSVPRDLSVIGYGNHTDGSLYRPRLTTVAPAWTTIAEDAVGTLIDMRTHEGFTPQSLNEPSQLVIRESTDPPRD